MPARLVALLLVVTAIVSGGVAAGVSWGIASSVAAGAGSAGSNGADGEAGADGQDGTAGVDGDDGAPGATGPAGPRGATGPAGRDGSASSVGATGPAGPAGATGPAGPSGTPGTNGTNGASAPTFSYADPGPLAPGSFGTRLIGILSGPVPDGAALIGYSVTINSSPFGDSVVCELRDGPNATYAQSVPTILPASTPVTIAATVVASLSIDTPLYLLCDGVSFTPWEVTGVSIYAISFAS
jgi:hypothetical protein